MRVGYPIQYGLTEMDENGYANRSGYGNLRLIPQSNQLAKICFGTLKTTNLNLHTIINKAIKNMPVETMQAIINSRVIRQPEQITLTDFMDSNPRVVILIVILFAAVLLGLLLLYFRKQIKLNRRISLENERYKQLAELSNEFIFEYDFRKDKLILSDKSARYFNVEQDIENYISELRANIPKEAKDELNFYDVLKKREK